MNVHRQHLADLQGAAQLALDATLGITGVVETLHDTIQRRPGPVGRSAGPGRTRGITGFVYRRVRGTMSLVGAGLDLALAPLGALLPAEEPSARRDAIVAALNGAYGDHLARSGNPLALEMSLRFRGQLLDVADPAELRAGLRQCGSRPRLLLLAHGLCLNEGHWLRDGHDHGAALADDLGVVPVYLRYNTGLPVATNGRALANLLERLLREWPGPAPELAIIGHSMGGLVLRSALHRGKQARHGWVQSVRDCVFLGTPQLGAPLERAGHWLDTVMEISPYVAPFTRLGKARSAGITDLRHGSVTGRAREWVPLPGNIRFHAAAATLAGRRSRLVDRLLGDGLVPLDSALGRSPDARRSLAIPKSRQWIGYGMGHMDLLGRPAVYDRLAAWLAPAS